MTTQTTTTLTDNILFEDLLASLTGPKWNPKKGELASNFNQIVRIVADEDPQRGWLVRDMTDGQQWYAATCFLLPVR